MTMLEFLPLAALICFVVYAFAQAMNMLPAVGWIVPAGLSLLFGAWTVMAVVQESAYGFWIDHTSSLWGAQIWFDLLLAASVALFFIVPEARRLGMRPLPWVVFVVVTGSVGLLAFLARVMFLRGKIVA